MDARKEPPAMVLWMYVTGDKYELPLAVTDTIEELSAITGKSLTNIRSSDSKRRHGKIRRSRYVMVEIEEDIYDI